jgi:hypothetical protein
MDCPHTFADLHHFIGCVNYYHDTWPSHAHVLKPLTDSSGLKKQKPLKWIDKMQAAFNNICLLKAADALSASLDQNKCFDVYKDSSPQMDR